MMTCLAVLIIISLIYTWIEVDTRIMTFVWMSVYPPQSKSAGWIGVDCELKFRTNPPHGLSGYMSIKEAIAWMPMSNESTSIRVSRWVGVP